MDSSIIGRKARCDRCGRVMGPMEEEGEDAVCTGCLTLLEDIEETRLLTTLLKRRCRELGEPDRDLAQSLRRVLSHVLQNLDRRRFGPAASVPAPKRNLAVGAALPTLSLAIPVTDEDQSPPPKR
jgi:hypothetical protein